MNPKVYAPNVHLFAFHLRNKSDEKDKYWLWQSCDEIIAKTLHSNLNLVEWLDLDKEQNNPRVPLIKADKVKNNNFSIPVAGEVCLDGKSPLKITGLAYPLLIYDSYGLWLNLRRPEKEQGEKTEDVEIQILGKLNPDNCFVLQGNNNFLGETLLITAWLSEHDPQNQQAVKNLADECLKAFFPKNYPIPPFSRQSTLFGSPIFEYGLFSQLKNYRHVLVWLFRDDEADKKFNECYQQLIDLFFFRSKVVAAFQKSRDVYDATNQEYQKIEEEIKSLQQQRKENILNESELDKLESKLKILPNLALEYAQLLRFLENYQNTIAINARNYTERLEQIRSIIPNEDIGFLENFSQENSPYFQEQIRVELGYFHHGSGLIDKAIASIRGRVAIDRARCDRISEDNKEKRARNLEITILAVGTAISAGGILASSYALVTEEDPLLPPFSTPIPHRFTLSIIYSLGFGIAVGVLIFILDKIIQRWKKR